ncbi:hypothetical protein LTR49_022544 [Elasticomyces elasticus]|nr:hypothetical protein LTR49_022544 [Elasticomyces elasticus]KAK5755692.1 hypothetical protein LTS12_014253 [Elasticomyces elasticus]
MRSSIMIAPFVAAAYAQSSSELVQTGVVSANTTTYTTTWTYSNGFTSYLTETNSLGVVTGMPSAATAATSLPGAITTQPSVITSQPAVATIPAGLPVGVTSIAQNASGSLSYFSVSVGSSTTVVMLPSTASVVTAASGSSGSGSGASGSGSAGASGASATGGSATSSGAASSSSAASAASANNVQYASAGLLGLGALFAALL